MRRRRECEADDCKHRFTTYEMKVDDLATLNESLTLALDILAPVSVHRRKPQGKGRKAKAGKAAPTSRDLK